MADGFSLLGLNLPFYMVITLILSYFIWSKFLKDNQLGIENIDDLLDIFSIFTFIIIILISLTSLYLIIDGLFNLEVSLGLIINSIPNLVTFFVLLGVWLFTVSYRNEKVSKNDLKIIFINFIKFLIGVLIVFLSICLIILITILRYVLWDILFFIPVIILIILISYSTVNNVLFDVNFKQIIGKRYIIMLVILFLITSIFGLLSIPIIKYKDPIYIGYKIHNEYPDYGDIYLHTRIPIQIKTFGLIGSIIPIIPIRYGVYEIETEGFGGNNFKIDVNSTNNGGGYLISNFNDINKFSDTKFNFTKIVLDQNKKLIKLKFNAYNIKNEKISEIFLEGYIKKNKTKLDYSYSDNLKYSEACNSKGCTFEFEIDNNLELPVYQAGTILMDLENRNIENISNCKFTNVFSNFPREGDIRMTSPTCHDNWCEFYIINTNLNKEMFSMDLFIDRNLVKLNFMEIYVPITLNGKFDLRC